MNQEFSKVSSPLIRECRGRGMMQCIEIERESNVTGHDFCDIMKTHGLLTKATKDYACRFTPSLVMNEAEVDEVKIIV